MPTRHGDSLANHVTTVPRRKLRRTTTSPHRLTPCTWNTRFARSRPIVLISSMDGSLKLDNYAAQLWHIDAVRGPSTPSSLGMTALVGRSSISPIQPTPVNNPFRGRHLPPAPFDTILAFIQETSGGSASVERSIRS